MGLDTYAARFPHGGMSEEDELAFAAADIHLCGGVLSGGGSSFRGKLYAGFISEVTGVSLYQEWIPPEVVKGMSIILNSHRTWALLKYSPVQEGRYDDVSRSSINNIKKYFQVCASRNLGLRGWW